MSEQRTIQQNKALHKYYRELAEALNAAGLDMKTVLKPEIEIPWTQESVKNHLWRPVQKIMESKESTTELDTRDVSAIYDVVDRHIASKFGVHVEFPSDERMAMEHVVNAH